MAKPWGRIELDYINHDKFKALNANAICLWHEGKNYCDVRLTDGLIPAATAKLFRFYSKKAAAFLMVSAGAKPGTDQQYAPLWEVIEGFGFKMHDYLEHNDGRDVVLARIAKADAAKQADADRKAAARAEKEAKRIAGHTTGHDTGHPPDTGRISEPVRQMSGSIQNQKHLQKEPEEREARVSLSPPADPFLNSQTTDRAGDFVRRYEILYPQHRKGARYAVKPTRDYAAAVTLCATWADDARLDKLAIVFLECDNKFAEEGSRTIPQFLALASWCDGKLAEWEATHQVSA